MESEVQYSLEVTFCYWNFLFSCSNASDAIYWQYCQIHLVCKKTLLGRFVLVIQGLKTLGSMVKVSVDVNRLLLGIKYPKIYWGQYNGVFSH